ncbi:2OG-Fe(II) oxygenase [Pseudomonadales bacterium]|nr:2OG-Fe(II) oxygenase [Pseudomonadales bacterium]
MILFDLLESNISKLKNQFQSAIPFEHIVIDNFCDSDSLEKALMQLPDPEISGLNRSRDLMFAKNKFEKSEFEQFGPELAQLKSDLLSDRFRKILVNITGQDLFVDPNFHGGGLHLGGTGSFLNMHADFNYHPSNPSWFRNINILLYLNKNWNKSYGGELKLRDGRENDGEVKLIEPLFNRAVIMFTREYTLHGYDVTSFPKGIYRSSVAAYGYTKQDAESSVRTTIWHPENSGILKTFIGKHMPKFVRVKSFVFGSGTKRNK